MDEEEQRKKEYLEFRKVFERDFLIIYRGRMKRLDFFFWVMALNGLGKILEKFETPQNSDYYYFIYFPLGYAAINFICKRVRDIGLSAWWAVIPALFGITIATLRELALAGELGEMPIDDDLVLMALIAGFVIFLLPLYFWPSQKRDNKYGRYFPYGYLSGYKASNKKEPQKQKPQKRRAL
ncbi:MAG: DUF805 domain-containing protein [Alphaproteobacteria bacterium]|nr:DUF805 domain-containing protein [Alphaproteobacteria bacterium]